MLGDCPCQRHSLKRTATQTRNPRNGFALHLQASIAKHHGRKNPNATKFLTRDDLRAIRCHSAPAVWRAFERGERRVFLLDNGLL